MALIGEATSVISKYIDLLIFLAALSGQAAGVISILIFDISHGSPWL